MAIVEFLKPESNKKAIVFSQAMRRQLYTIDLSAIFLVSIDSSKFPNPIDIENGKDATIDAFKAINPHFPKIFMSNKDKKKFNKQETKIRHILSDCFQGNRMTPDFLNALLLLAEKASFGAVRGKNNALEKAWVKLLASICNILEQIDADMSNPKWSMLGEKLALKFEKAMGVA